jgi:hypothetical protein
VVLPIQPGPAAADTGVMTISFRILALTLTASLLSCAAMTLILISARG